MNKIQNWLIQYKWYRSFCKTREYYKTNGQWKYYSEFVKGEKIEKVDGAWNSLTWCKCGNELVYSDSYIGSRFVKETQLTVFDYSCSYCGKKQHKNPCLMPGLHPCDEKGRLI